MICSSGPARSTRAVHKTIEKEKARLCKQEHQQIQRRTWVQVEEYTDHWSTVLSLTPRNQPVQARGGPLEATDEFVFVPRTEGQDAEEPPRGDLEMNLEGEGAVAQQQGNNEEQPLKVYNKCPMDSQQCSPPPCTHMSDEKDRNIARGKAFLEELSEVESVTDFLGDAKIHVWLDGSEVRGQAGFGVYFPHGDFPNVSQPVVGAQSNNRAEVSAVRAAIQRVPESQDLCLYSDSKWCVDIFSNLRVYKHRGWMVQGKKPVRRYDMWEDIYHMCQAKTTHISMTQVYGHKRLLYNEEAETLAKAGAAMSKVHRPRLSGTFHMAVQCPPNENRPGVGESRDRRRCRCQA